MSEQCRYVAIDGTVLHFKNSGKLFMGLSDLRQFSYEIRENNEKIYSFKRNKLRTPTLPIYITTADPTYRNHVFEVFEKDVAYKNQYPLSNKSGRLYIGDYYLPGFVFSSSPGNYLIQSKTLKKNLQFVCTSNAWIKEEEYIFNKYSDKGNTGGFDFPFDYEFDYGSSDTADLIENTSLQAADFIMTISGPVCAPSININKNVYSVNVVVDEGEYLTIDSANKEIFLTRSNGNTVNCFNERSRGTNIFAPIEPGINKVAYNKSIRFSIKLLLERSEPLWT